MPRRKYQSRRRFRRRSRGTRKGYFKRRPRFVGKGLSYNAPMPLRYKLKTRYYADGLTLNPGLGGIMTSHVFAINDLYDFDVTGVGHSALGFDQLMSMYDHFTVIGFKATIQMRNTDTGDTTSVCCFISDEATHEIDQRKVIENGLCSKMYMLSPDKSGSSAQCTMRVKCSLKKFFGVKNLISDNKFKGSATGSPTERAFLHVVAWHPLGEDPSDITFSITADFVALLTEPQKLGIS